MTHDDYTTAVNQVDWLAWALLELRLSDLRQHLHAQRDAIDRGHAVSPAVAAEIRRILSLADGLVSAREAARIYMEARPTCTARTS